MPPADDTSPDSAPAGSRRRIGHTLSEGWHLAVVAYRDPEHVAERIALNSTHSLGEPSLEWAQRVREEREGVPRAVIAEQLRTDSAKVAAIDGAVAGDAVPDRAGPRLPALPQAGGADAAAHRGAIRPRPTGARDRRRDAGAPRCAPDGRRCPLGPAPGARHTDAREASRAPPVAYVGPQHLRAADLRRVPLRPLRQEQGGRPPMGEDRDRGPVRS